MSEEPTERLIALTMTTTEAAAIVAELALLASGDPATRDWLYLSQLGDALATALQPTEGATP